MISWNQGFVWRTSTLSAHRWKVRDGGGGRGEGGGGATGFVRSLARLASASSAPKNTTEHTYALQHVATYCGRCFCVFLVRSVAKFTHAPLAGTARVALRAVAAPRCLVALAGAWWKRGRNIANRTRAVDSRVSAKGRLLKFRIGRSSKYPTRMKPRVQCHTFV